VVLLQSAYSAAFALCSPVSSAAKPARSWGDKASSAAATASGDNGADAVSGETAPDFAALGRND